MCTEHLVIHTIQYRCIKYCSRGGGGGGGEMGCTIIAYTERLRQKGTLFRLQVHERVFHS